MKKILLGICFCLLFSGAAFAAMSDQQFVELCQSGTPEQITQAIKGGANVNSLVTTQGSYTISGIFFDDVHKYNVYYTPLMFAVANPDHRVVTVLIDAGANVNAKDPNGSFALLSATGSKIKTIKLIKAGADVNAQDKYGYTALIMAAGYSKDPQVVDILLRAGADIKKRNSFGYDAMGQANSAGYSHRSATAFAEIKKMLEDAAEGKYKNVVSSEKSRKNIEKLLFMGKPLKDIESAIELGDLRGTDGDGRTLLMTAAMYHTDPRVISLLLEEKIDINATDNLGKTALILAAEYSKTPDVADMLIKAGAKIDMKDKSGRTALEYAQVLGKPSRDIIFAASEHGKKALAAAAEEKRKLAEAEAAKVAAVAGGSQSPIVGAAPLPKQISSAEFDAKLAAAIKGNAVAQAQLAEMYLIGNGTERDANEAVHWYKEAAEKGNTEAQVNLAELFMKGLGCVQDMAKARELLIPVAKKGHKAAARLLGYNYEVGGDGVKKDFNEAITWYRKAADAGDGEAQARLAQCFMDGIGVSKNLNRALQLATLSAGQNNPKGFELLWDMYRRGVGVKADAAKSLDYLKGAAAIYEREAQGGDPYIEYALADCYFKLWYMARNGQGDPGGLFEKGVKWGVLAGEHGNSNGYYLVGAWTSEERYFKLAADMGNPKAEAELQKIAQREAEKAANERLQAQERDNERREAKAREDAEEARSNAFTRWAVFDVFLPRVLK